MRVRLDPVQVDQLAAAVLLVGYELQVALGVRSVAAAVIGGVVCASLAVRRRFPLTTGFGVQALMVLAVGIGVDQPAGFVTVAWFCAFYTLAVWTTTPWFVTALAALALAFLLPEAVHPDKPGTIVPFTAGVVAVMVLVRRVLGDRDRRLRLAERERELARREAVVEERARIARELHDAIAHHVSMMVLQAGAERRVVDDGATREVLETIEQSGRGALTEMRRLVGMLRSGDGEPLAPQPGLDDVPTLVGQLREAGLPVVLAVEGEPRRLPLGIELSAYRIVQEALTNALKHAGDARASVRIVYGRDSLELEIVDDGAGATAPVAGGGHGLVGMRERVALYGGRLEASRAAGGGFSVRALLPTR